MKVSRKIFSSGWYGDNAYLRFKAYFNAFGDVYSFQLKNLTLRGFGFVVFWDIRDAMRCVATPLPAEKTAEQAADNVHISFAHQSKYDGCDDDQVLIERSEDCASLSAMRVKQYLEDHFGQVAEVMDDGSSALVVRFYNLGSCTAAAAAGHIEFPDHSGSMKATRISRAPSDDVGSVRKPSERPERRPRSLSPSPERRRRVKLTLTPPPPPPPPLPVQPIWPAPYQTEVELHLLRQQNAMLLQLLQKTLK